MIITWFGQSCFRLQGDSSTLVTDPYDQSLGLRLPRLTADIVTVSHDHHDHNNVAAVKGVDGSPRSAGEAGNAPFTITMPGEYEVKGTFVYGIPAFHDNKQGAERGPNIIYRIEMDGITLAHLGDLGHPLTNGEIEKLEGVDILMIPVVGFYTIDAKQATEIISQLEPRLIIPMHYQLPGLTTSKLADVRAFCKEMGVTPNGAEPKLKVTKRDLPQEDMKVVILTP